jgi:hypothetical protein
VSAVVLLICERGNLLLLYLVIGKVLLVLFPARACCGGHVCASGGGGGGDGEGDGDGDVGMAEGCVCVCVCVACAGQTCSVGGGGGLNEGVGVGQVGTGCLFVMRTAVGGHDGDGGRASAVRAWRVLVLVPLSRPAARIKIIQVARAARDHTHPPTHQPTIPRLHPPYNTHHSTTQHGSPSCKRRRRRRRKCCLQGTMRTDTCA